MSIDQQPLDAGQALAMVQAGLSFLAGCPARATLIGLEQAEARLTAARAQVLSEFCASHDYEADGQFGPKPWLRAFTRVTRGAAEAAMAWMRRLEAHPAVAAALAAEEISVSWAREICAWTSKLPAGLVADADAILLAAAAAGADLADLAQLAWEMIERAAAPDADPDGFADRGLWLQTTLAGAGRLGADLTPGCAAALRIVLDALSEKAGPEDTRSLSQRHHDALEEACQRLIAAGMLPGRDGQPLHLYAHLDLATLAGLSGPEGEGGQAEGSALEGRLARPAAVGPASWYPTGPEAGAAACDATIAPVISGHLDWAALDDLTDLLLKAYAEAHDEAAADGQAARADALSPALHQELRHALLQGAISLLSGPSGLAAQVRTQTLDHPFNGHSQPLDLGAPTPVIPAALRRAVTLRDQHCRFPGCDQPPSVCQVHHLRPRAHDGPTALDNLALLCRFHHLIVIHRWGWTLAWHPDGTTTATSPDGRSLASPPRRVA
jgi:hypothetical protein